MNLDAIGGSGVDEVYFITGLNVGNGTLNSNVTLNAELGGGDDRFASAHQRLDVEVDSTIAVRASEERATMNSQRVSPIPLTAASKASPSTTSLVDWETTNSSASLSAITPPGS